MTTSSLFKAFLLIALLGVAWVSAVPTPHHNSPVALALDPHITLILSCKSTNKLACKRLVAVAKLSNDSVPYSNEVSLSQAFSQQPTSLRHFAAAQIDRNSAVVTALSPTQQYIATLSLVGTQLSVRTVLPPIASSGVLSVDIAPLYNGREEFYVVADFANQRKLARVAADAFASRQISRSHAAKRSAIAGDAQGAYISEGGDCARRRLLYVGYSATGDIAGCAKDKTVRCSTAGRQGVSYLSGQRALLSLINGHDAYIYTLNTPSSLANGVAAASNATRDWNHADQHLRCPNSNLLAGQISIDLANHVTDVQATVDAAQSPAQVAISFQSEALGACTINGNVYTAGQNGSLSRLIDADNQEVGFSAVPCAAYGFDRVVFNEEFILLRYDVTKIQLNTLPLPRQGPYYQ